ncbi:MerR family transcriptional regulator [Streptomyces sp. NPDC056367]|uniref:MerR family transcriptional regulator n=1 Tax=Streptomyces sp. NPDC056367 TaxID=3345797 RepID=UPI0035E07794
MLQPCPRGKVECDDGRMITIGQLARYVGVSVKTIRVYHDKGLFPEPERDGSGYRRYGADEVIALIKIRTLAEAGVPLARNPRPWIGCRRGAPGRAARDRRRAHRPHPRSAGRTRAPAPARRRGSDTAARRGRLPSGASHRLGIHSALGGPAARSVDPGVRHSPGPRVHPVPRPGRDPRRSGPTTAPPGLRPRARPRRRRPPDRRPRPPDHRRDPPALRLRRAARTGHGIRDPRPRPGLGQRLVPGVAATRRSSRPLPDPPRR